jgi:hypothetical protein
MLVVSTEGVKLGESMRLARESCWGPEIQALNELHYTGVKSSHVLTKIFPSRH